MVVSTLCRSALDQTLGHCSPDDAFFIEEELQKYKISGVVSALRSSIEQSASPIVHYVANHHRLDRFARTDRPGLLLPRILFDEIQKLSVDFTWSLWEEMCKIDPIHYPLFSEAVHRATTSQVPSVAYAMAIFKSQRDQIEESVQLHRAATKLRPVTFIRNVTRSSIARWRDMSAQL